MTTCEFKWRFKNNSFYCVTICKNIYIGRCSTPRKRPHIFSLTLTTQYLYENRYNHKAFDREEGSESWTDMKGWGKRQPLPVHWIMFGYSLPTLIVLGEGPDQIFREDTRKEGLERTDFTNTRVPSGILGTLLLLSRCVTFLGPKDFVSSVFFGCLSFWPSPDDILSK